MYDFYWLVDHGRANETAELFTETARLTFGPMAPKPGTIEGAAIASAMATRTRQIEVTTRHVLSNVRLSPREDAAVEATSLLTLFRSEESARHSYPEVVADIEELFVRTAAGWRIQERTISPVFKRGR